MAEPPAPPRKFSEALFCASVTPPAQLTAIECRLLAIAGDLFQRTALLIRIMDAVDAGTDPNQPGIMKPLTEAQAGRAAKLSLVAAIELEQPLREIRNKLTKGD